MLASTSSVRADASYNDPQYFIKRQLIWLLPAILAGVFMARFDYHWWRRPIFFLLLASGSLFLLALVFVPGIGMRVGGSYRWIRLGPLSLQPSEIAKLAVVILMSLWMERVGRRARLFKEGVLFPFIGLGAFLALIILEPDFGTTALVGVVGCAIMFAGGTSLHYLLMLAVAAGCGFVIMVLHDPVRLVRVTAFLYPERYPVTAYHLTQSKAAFIRGGPWGRGLGNSIQKQFYLPEAHTDFILAIIGEELGFVFTFVVLLMFAGILVCGIYISLHAPDLLGRLMAFGVTLLLVLQAAINVGVVTGCLPTKGLPLPFISYGGSSLVGAMAAIGILVNVALHCGNEERHAHSRAVKNRARRLK